MCIRDSPCLLRHFSGPLAAAKVESFVCDAVRGQERNQLSITLTNLQVDFDNLNARLDEEAETSASLRAQLQRAQADYQALKGKYDKEVTARVEEFEETRYVLLSRHCCSFRRAFKLAAPSVVRPPS